MSEKKDDYEVPRATGELTLAPLQGQGYAYAFQDPTPRLPADLRAHYSRLLKEEGIGRLLDEERKLKKACAWAEDELEKQADAIARLQRMHDPDRWDSDHFLKNIEDVQKKREQGRTDRGKLRRRREALRAFLMEEGAAPLEKTKPPCPYKAPTPTYLRLAYEWLEDGNRPKGDKPTDLWGHLHNKTGASRRNLRSIFRRHGWYDPHCTGETPTEHTVREVLKEGRRYFSRAGTQNGTQNGTE